MWYSRSHHAAEDSRKLRTSPRPKSKTRVPHPACSRFRGSPYSYRQVPSNSMSPWLSLQKWAGTQSRMTPSPA